jgi:3-hydroxybutyryl-CoA dehydratase
MTSIAQRGVYDKLYVGYQFGRRMTMTETHLLLANAVLGDSVPLHTDELTGQASMYGGRILPGPLVAGLAAVTLGMTLGGAAIGYLEQREVFKAAVKPGDTITVTWTVLEKVDKERFKGGIVTFGGECTNQDGVVAIECTGVAIITNEPAE